MAKTQDFTKILQDMMASAPVDAAKFQDAFKAQAALGEKMAKVALDAAEKSTEITSKWAKDAIAKIGSLAEKKEEPAEYAKALSDFASSSAEIAAENLAAFAEVAKKVQMETVELMLAAGKDISEDATAAVKKATEEVTAVAKKATSTVATPK
ncbi:phasin family protein [Paenirhodobacter sp.]|uniref:phasin family protein n=1 Tax=Paenirhodobacter sp. TaxID=1965326 RepID=UPI003B3DE4CF